MHFEILVEGQTELTVLSTIMNQIIGEYQAPHTWKIHKHRGIGKIPEKPSERPNKIDQSLLHNLPAKLKAYGEEKRTDLVIVVLVDLDDQLDCVAFKNRLVELLDICENKPSVLFRIAIEELEAWLLGDQIAVKTAYPKANQKVLDEYVQDSQTGTWESMAEAIFPGGRKALEKNGKRSAHILEQKLEWARKISPILDVERNQSPSFKCFRDALRRMAIG